MSNHNDKDTPENIIRRRAALFASYEWLHQEQARQYRFMESCRDRVIAECPHSFQPPIDPHKGTAICEYCGCSIYEVEHEQG